MAAEYDIGAAFAAIEEELISSMMRNLNRHRAEEDAEGYRWSQWQAEQLKALEDYKRQNQKKYGKQFRSINQQLEQALRAAYAQGGTEQEATILRAIRDGAQLWRPGGSLRSSSFRLNQRKLEALIQATTGDMERAETAILRRTNDQYRKVIYNAQVYANTGAGTYEKAVDMATKDFLSAGIQCVVYQNGARHTLSDYADMALRTAAKRAYLQGEGVKRQEWGVSTVIINRRGGACPQCAKFCGKVFIDDVWSGGKRSDGNYPLLSKAIEQGLYHPRCKDSHSTWFPELYEDEQPYTEKEIAQLEGREQQEQKEQNARRQAEKYRRLERYALDGENRRKYGARAAEWEEQAGQSSVQAASEPKTPSYIDVTGAWYPDAKPGSHPVQKLDAYTVGGVTYHVDGHSVVHDHDVHEKEIAQLLEREVGGEIFLVPRVNDPQSVSTPDYLFHGKGYDLKTLGEAAGPDTMFNRVKKAKRQAHNFIIDVTNTSLDEKTIDQQIRKIFWSKNTLFVDEIVIVNGEKIVRVVKRA